jgi:hypothetical protein
MHTNSPLLLPYKLFLGKLGCLIEGCMDSEAGWAAGMATIIN